MASPAAPAPGELGALAQPRSPEFANRSHFFAAAAEAMRRILVERARRKRRLRHGGGLQQQPLEENEPAIAAPVDALDLLALDEAIQKLQAQKPDLADIVMLRYYTGLSVEETADVLGKSLRTVYRDWRHARTWLALEMGEAGSAGRMADDR